MARTNITAHAPLGPYPAGGSVAPGALDVTKTAADVSNKNSFTATGAEVLYAENTDTVTHTITITSTPDERNRTADVTAYTLAANGGVSRFDFRGGLVGWKQNDGKVYFEANDATVKFWVEQP